MPCPDNFKHVLPVTEEEIVDFFTSESFLHALNETANYTYSKGHESGFLAERGLFDNKIKMTEIVFGSSDILTFNGCQGMEGIRIKHLYPGSHKREIGGLTLGHYRFLGYHFHPEARGPPMPSEDDLLSANHPPPPYAEVQKWDVRPIQGIGVVDNQREIEILLYQKSFRGELHRRDMRELLYVFDPMRPFSADDVIKNLQNSGYFKTQFLHYSRKGVDYSPRMDELENLADFTYMPEIQIESWLMNWHMR